MTGTSSLGRIARNIFNKPTGNIFDEPTNTGNPSREQQELMVKGILNGEEPFGVSPADDDREADSETLREWVTDGVYGTAQAVVSASQLQELSELPCFDDSPFEVSRAVGFASQYADAVIVTVRIDKYEDKFCVELHSVRVEGEVTNEMVSRFAQDFGRSISADFDPLAENHDEPYLCVRPF